MDEATDVTPEQWEYFDKALGRKHPYELLEDPTGPVIHWCWIRNAVNYIKSKLKLNTSEPDKCKSCPGPTKCRSIV